MDYLVLAGARSGFKNFDKAKELCFTNPVTAHQLLQKITDTTIAYLKAKVEAGVNAVQIFDSWGMYRLRLSRVFVAVHQPDH